MWDLIWQVVPFAISMAASPGPNNVLVTASAINFGLRRTLAPILGIALGLSLMILVMGLGLGTVLEEFPAAHRALKYLGATYLLYLAWRLATSAGPGDTTGKGRPLSFLEAALFQWVNPKAWVASVSAVAAYTAAGADLPAQVAVISAVFAIIGFLAVGSWALFGHAAAKLLRTPAHLRRFNLAMAALLVISIATIFE